MANKKKRITIYDVARKAGVSHMTVSRVLNETPESVVTSESTRQKVLRVVKEIGYRRDSTARALALSRTDTIALAVYDVDYLVLPGFSSILVGIVHRMARQNYNLHLVTTSRTPQAEERGTYFLEPIRERRVDGLIIMDHFVSDDEIRRVQDYGVPCVLIERQVDSSGAIYSVGVNNRKGMALATEHLLDLGHKQIACVVGSFSDDRDREMVAGYRTAMASRRLDFDESLVWSLPDSPVERIETLLNERKMPTGLIASSDDNAARLIAALMRRKLRIPEDASVITYGGEWEKLNVAHFVPHVTEVRTPLRDIGEIATGILLEALKEGRPTRSLVLLEPELHVGTSTAPPRRT